MAESGGQPGNKTSVIRKRWYQAIDRALAKRSRVSGIEALDELAEKLLKGAEAGEAWALKELGDRLDGKPHQTVSGPDDKPLISGIELIMRTAGKQTVDEPDKG